MRTEANLRFLVTGRCLPLLLSLMMGTGCDSGSPKKPDVTPVGSFQSEAPKLDAPAAPQISASTISKNQQVQPSISEPKVSQNEASKPVAVNRSAELALNEATTFSPQQPHVEIPNNSPEPESQTASVTVDQIPSLPQRYAKPQLSDIPDVLDSVPPATDPPATVQRQEQPLRTDPIKTEEPRSEAKSPDKPGKSKTEKKERGKKGDQGPGEDDGDEKGKKVDSSDEFFNKGLIPEIRITLTEKEEAQLRRDLRRYVDISFTENGETTYQKVKMKLKGAAGSFRDLNDRPALTLSMRGKGERFHGLEKFHLNNSVQDETYLNELIASELCHEAGLPAARTTHARVWLNGRDLGFYVLKEGMDERFVKRHFKSAKGNFYEGGFCADIDAPLEKEFGDGPDDRSDLKEVIDVCREADQTRRWQLVEEKVAIDDFLNFTALELMMCHWDGYCNNRNNYRIYFPAEDKKIRFLPHGMDQMFGDINFGVFQVPGPLVANAVLSNPVVHTRYRQRVRELLPLFSPEKLHAKIDAAHARIRPVLAAIHEDQARQFDGRVTDYKNRLAGRLQAIKSQFPPEPIAFNSEGWALAEDWTAKPQGDAKLEQLEADGKKVLSLTPGPSNQVQASFRTKVRLARGTYRLDAKVQTRDVLATPEEKGFGAGVRLGGGVRQNHVVGTTDWETVSHEFEIGQDLQEVELVAELRSTAGSARFDLSSLRIYKLK